MTVPGDLTATLIVTEAYYKVGTPSPSSAQITRAEGYFLREIINKIWTWTDRFENPVRYKSLQTTNIQVTGVGRSRYSFATDLDDEISISFMTGSHADTATAGAATTITLAADEDASEDEIVGNYIFLTAGTGAAQLRQVSAYNTTTLVATVPTWTTNPSTDTTYRIISTITELEEDSLESLGVLGSSWSLGNPSCYAKTIEDGVLYYYLDRPADASTHGLYELYYADPNRVDLTSAVMTRIYNNWQEALTTGVAMKIAQDEDDNKYKSFKSEFEFAVQRLVAKELPHSAEFEGFTL